MSEQLEKEIQHLNRLIMNVGTKVEEALQNAMIAVREMDPAKVKMVNENKLRCFSKKRCKFGKNSFGNG